MHIRSLFSPRRDPTASEAIAHVDKVTFTTERMTEMSNKEIRVRSKTSVASLGQSIAQALRNDPVITVSAVGVTACHVAQRGIGASANLMEQPPWTQIQLTHVQFPENGDGSTEREGSHFVVARDLESAAEFEKTRESE